LFMPWKTCSFTVRGEHGEYLGNAYCKRH